MRRRGRRLRGVPRQRRLHRHRATLLRSAARVLRRVHDQRHVRSAQALRRERTSMRRHVRRRRRGLPERPVVPRGPQALRRVPQQRELRRPSDGQDVRHRDRPLRRVRVERAVRHREAHLRSPERPLRRVSHVAGVRHESGLRPEHAALPRSLSAWVSPRAEHSGASLAAGSKATNPPSRSLRAPAELSVSAGISPRRQRGSEGQRERLLTLLQVDFGRGSRSTQAAASTRRLVSNSVWSRSIAQAT